MIMGARLQLTGLRFNRLVVMRYYGKAVDKKALWECVCDCGNIVITTSSRLNSGTTGSCGCYRSDLTTKTYTKHGHSVPGKHTSEYTAWNNIKDRCYNPNNNRYDRYGGRGITVCDRWLESFTNFLSDMGVKPSKKHSIERDNNNGNYEPDNCFWATSKTQSRNKSNNIWIEHNGEKLILSEWATKLGCSSTTISKYLKMGLPMQWIINKFNNEKEYRDFRRSIQKS